MNKSLAEELQVEVVDDTPETDKPFVKEEKKEEEVKETSEENELEGYSEKVQKRIKKMKYDYHEPKNLLNGCVKKLSSLQKIKSMKMKD